MISVTKLDNSKIILNADHIEKLEEVPDTVITLVNGRQYIVLDSVEDIVKRVIQYKRKIYVQQL